MSTHAPARPTYAAVLRLPHARRAFAAALIGRLSYGTVSLAVLLSVTRSTGSYAVSGTVLSLFGATTVFLMPLRASLIDRYGPRRVLPPMAALYGVLLCALAAVTWQRGAPSAPVATLAALAGACAPPLGPTMRAVWAELAPEPGMLARAYSLDGVAEELLYVSGPALVGALTGVAPPASGILLSAVLVVAGTAAFVTSPALPGPRPAPSGGRGGTARGLLTPIAVAAGAGLALSGVDLLVMAFASRHSYGTALVPWVLGALSAGSAVGGLVNGAVRWRAPARVRLCGFGLGLGLVVAVAGLAPDMWTLTGAMVLAGAFIAPTLTTAYLVADELSGEGTRTRSGAWVNTAVNAGSSAGALATGLLIGRLPLQVCFALAGAAALTGAVGALGRPGRSGLRGVPAGPSGARRSASGPCPVRSAPPATADR